MTDAAFTDDDMTMLQARIAARTSEPDANGCQRWVGAVTSTGYGVTRHRGRDYIVSRLALTLADGMHDCPDPLVLALHSCDEKLCAAVAHLRWGSHADNARDAVERGQHWSPKGSTCPRGHEYGEQWHPARACPECGWEPNRARSHSSV